MHPGGPQGPALRALAHWQHAAGPFWLYVAAAPFLSAPEVPFELPVPSAPQFDPDPGAALFLDLPPDETLPLAPALNRARLFVVPVMQRWCVQPAVVPSQDLVARLAGYAHYLRRPREPRGVVFLLDGDRAGPKRIRTNSFDNRYRYNLNAFPPGAVLKRHGITHARLLSKGEPAQDLWGYVAALRQQGLDVMLNEVKHLEGGRGPNPAPSRFFAGAQNDR